MPKPDPPIPFASDEDPSTTINRLKKRIRELENEVHDLQKAQAILQQSEKTYRTVFENTGTATILIEEDATISMANTEYEHLSGFSREEIEGKQAWTVFVQGEDGKRMRDYHRRRRIHPESVPRTYECRLRNKAGEDKIAMMTVAMIPGTSQSIASIRDITKRRMAQKALKRSEEKFAKAFRASPVAIMIATMNDGRIMDINDSFLDLTGFTKASIIGTPVKAVAFWPESSHHKRLARELVRTGHFRHREMAYRTSKGEIRYGSISADIIELAGESCMLTAVLDITQERRLEKEILRIGEEERRKIGYDLHDDLGQHLVGVEALATLLRQRLTATRHPDAELAAEITQLIRTATTKTRNLAKGLCPVNLDAGGLATALQELACQITTVFGVDCSLTIHSDPAEMEHTVAINLYRIAQEALSNALRHGKADRIAIRLHHPPAICLEITDNGMGLRDPICKISGKTGGMGLGIMQHRARRIGADLDIRNRTLQPGVQLLCRIHPES